MSAPSGLSSDVTRRHIRLPDRLLEIATVDWGGDGPPLLLHHANGFCGALWDPVVQKLRDRFRCLAIDARGHGDSTRPAPSRPGSYRWVEMAADLAAVGRRLLDEIGAERFAAGIGHSFGGTLTLTAASRFPSLYERILLVDPVIIPPAVAKSPERIQRSQGMVDRARKRRDGWASRDEAREFFLSRKLFDDWEPRALELYVEEGLRDRGDGTVGLKCPGAVEGAIFAGDQGMDVFAVAAGVEVPTRLLWARRGNFPRELYDHLTAPMADADIVDMEAAHLMVMEEPARVADEVLRFVPSPGAVTPKGA